MFEKEAEEYATKHTYNGDKYTTFEWWYRRNGFQDGAEFGYNKAKEEMQELLKEGVQLLKNSDELYGYQIRDFYLKCKPFIKED